MNSATDTSLTITRVFKTTPEQLWEIWTNPAEISKWHRLNKPGASTVAEGDVRVGGEYKIAMKYNDATTVVVGEYKELDPPKRMVLTWRFEADPSGHESEVTIQLRPVDDGTELTLTHVRLAGPEAVKAHAEGWIGGMNNIDDLIIKER